MERKIDINKIMLALLLMFPFIDTLNGVIQLSFHTDFSLGTIYRIIFLAFCCYLIIDIKINRNNLIGLLLVFVLLFSVLFHFEADRNSDIVDISKIALAPFTFLAFRKLIYKDDYFVITLKKIFGYYCVIFPLTLIIPYIFNLGYSSYGEAGFKGYYIALNAISNTIIVTSIYSFYMLVNKLSIHGIVIFIMNAFCILLMGTKSGYLLMIISIIVILIYDYYRHKVLRQSVLQLLLIGMTAIVSMLLLFHEEITSIFSRWDYFMKQRNLISFLTSARSDRLMPILNFIIHSPYGILYLFFGYGNIQNASLEYSLMEMDFFDILFSYGIINFILIIAFLYRGYKIYQRSNQGDKFFGFLFIIMIIIAFFVGHVFVNALSNTIFAMIMTLMCYGKMEGKKRVETCALEHNLSGISA